VTDPFAELNTALADHYVIDRELGRGGMALVYLARDVKHERFVALKTLRPEIALALGRERFLREIKLAARLQHPNILPVYDSGDASGTLFYVMPFVEGESLRDRLEREPQLPLDDALRSPRSCRCVGLRAQPRRRAPRHQPNILCRAGTRSRPIRARGRCGRQ
jgi:serine/threonine-protein kinase